MWVFSVVQEPIDWEEGLFDPQLAEALLGGAEFLATFLEELSSDPQKPMPSPLTCNICDRQIQPWFFEKHTALCIVSHKAESEVQDCHDQLRDQRQLVTLALRELESSSSPVLYKKIQIAGALQGASPKPSHGSNPGSPSHAFGRPEKQRKLQIRVVELLLDYCDLAIDVNTPAIPEDDSGDVFSRIQSPDSQARITQIQAWQQPAFEDHSLTPLCSDIRGLVMAKLSAITRLHNTIHYSEKIRQEIDARVQDLIDEATERALAASELDLNDESSGLQPQPPVVYLPQLTDLDRPDTAPISSSAGDDESVHDGTIAFTAPFGRSEYRFHQLPTVGKVNSSHADLVAEHEPRASSPLSQFPPLVQGDQDTRSSLSMFSTIPRPPSSTTLGELAPPPVPASTSRRNSPQDLELQIREMRSGRGIYESPRRPSVGSRSQGLSPSRRPSRAVSKGRAASLARERAPSPGRKVLSTRLGLLERERLSPSGSPTLSATDSNSTEASVRERRISMGPPLSPRLPSIAPAARPAPPSIKDFEIIKPISRGAFGSVYLSKKRTTGDYYAIKVLRKSDMIAKNQVTNIKAERAIMMAQTESPFITKLYFTFQSKENLYLVMEYLNGGDCAALIKQLGGLPEDWTRRYMSEVVLGLEYLHSRGIIHRDLKPDNLLISHNGHLKLTDFGLSRVGLVGRQNRARNSSHPETPDFLNSGAHHPQHHRSASPSSSRSASFDFANSGLSTPAFAPTSLGDSRSGYFNVRNRKTSQSNPAELGASEIENFSSAVSKLNLDDSKYDSDDGASTASGHSSSGFGSGRAHHETHIRSPTASLSATQMPPPAMKLFDPRDENKRFVGTPDYLAPETIDGTGQDDMVDWWSLGVILFEFMYGYPPFHASSPDAVFQNILNHRIDWPSAAEDLELGISDNAKDLMNRLMTINPNERLGSDAGAADIKGHIFFDGVVWEKISEEEALFVPTPDHPEDTEYFDARGATDLVLDDDIDAEKLPDISRLAVETDVKSMGSPDASLPVKIANHHRQLLKRTMMPLSIPAHVRDKSHRNRRTSESGKDEFGTFTFKNLSMLEKQNLEAIRKLRTEQTVSSPITVPRDSQVAHHMRSASSSSSGQARRIASSSSSATSSTPISPNHLAVPRNSLPSSPLIQSVSPKLTRHRSRASISAFPTAPSVNHSQYPNEPCDDDSPTKSTRHSNSLPLPSLTPGSPRSRAFTVGSEERPEMPFAWSSAKRIPRVFEPDTPSSSSDTETTSGAKALHRVQRRRSQSRRLSSISVTETVPSARTSYPLDILICEDNPVSRRVLEAMLAKLKCRVVSVVDGAEAVAAATGDVVFDLIFTDIKVPRLSGVEVARLVRSSSGSNSVTPIVAMSSYSTSEIRDMTDIFEKRLEKPLTIAAISETIQQLIENWEPPVQIAKKS